MNIGYKYGSNNPHNLGYIEPLITGVAPRKKRSPNFSNLFVWDYMYIYIYVRHLSGNVDVSPIEFRNGSLFS